MSGKDIAFLNWKQGMAFLINNAEGTDVEIYDNDGTQTVVPVESYPCFFLSGNNSFRIYFPGCKWEADWIINQSLLL